MIKADGKHLFPMEGVEVWKNPQNKFCVFQCHYTADPDKRSEEFRLDKKSSLPLRKFMMEYEIHWESFSGLPVYGDTWNRKIHVVEGEIKPDLGLPLLLGWDWGLCYSDDTEILTDNGFKLFKDLTDDDKVATMNPESRYIEYHKPSQRVSYDWDKEMLEWDSNSVNFCVTPEHLVPYTKRESPHQIRWASAQELSENRTTHNYIQLTSQWGGEFQLNPIGLDSITFAQFMGIYLSEGSVDKKTNRIVIYQEKPLVRDEIRRLLNKMLIVFKETKEGFRFSDKKIASYLRLFGTQKERFIPQEIKMNLIPVISEFIHFYTLGDGSIRNRAGHGEEHRIYTCSESMTRDLQELAIKMGWTSSSVFVKPTKSFYEREKRWILSGGGWLVRFKKNLHRAELLKEHFRRIPYKGKIYCVTVPHHILCIRRGGRTSWNGNTPACVVAQIVGTRLMVLREFVATNMGASRFVPLVIKELLTAYPMWRNISKDYICFIDPAGLQRAQTDESTCVQVLTDSGFKNIVPGAVGFEERRQSVEEFLTRLEGGRAAFQISSARCPTLIKGFDGGYHFKEGQDEIEPNKLEPLKNIYSHCQDSLQYLCSKIMKISRSSRANVPVPSYSWTKSA